MLKESVGCQDQMFAAVGGFNLIEFRSLGNFTVHRIPFSMARLREFEDHLLVFFTGIKRRAGFIRGFCQGATAKAPKRRAIARAVLTHSVLALSRSSIVRIWSARRTAIAAPSRRLCAPAGS